MIAPFLPEDPARIRRESGATDFMTEQHIDLNLRERREFPESLTQTIRDLANGKKPRGVCTSISKAIAMTSDQPCGSNEFFVQVGNLRTSRELKTRGLSAGTQNPGGYLIGVELSEIELALRLASVLVAAGARIVPLTGNLAARREMTAAIAQWLAETDTVTEQTETYGHRRRLHARRSAPSLVVVTSSPAARIA